MKSTLEQALLLTVCVGVMTVQLMVASPFETWVLENSSHSRIGQALKEFHNHLGEMLPVSLSSVVYSSVIF